MSHDHIRGAADAPVTVVEYGDYECPLCGAAHPNVLLLMRQFGDQLRLVFRHFPLTQIHPNAEPAAEAAEYAGTHGKFWQMHDGLFENQESLGFPLFFALADALQLPGVGLRKALENAEFAAKIRADFVSGVRSGVNGTPTFFINGRRHDGSYALDDLAAAVDAHLSNAISPV
jgi:protein-disulfide isomerase